MTKKEPSFFDGRTAAAIILVIGIIFGWQMYLAKKYPVAPNQVTGDTSGVVSSADNQEPAELKSKEGTKQALPPEYPVQASESTVAFTSPNFNFQISSFGMGLKSVELNKYTDRKGEKIKIGSDDGDRNLFELLINAPGLERLNFNVQKKSENEFYGSFKQGEVEIEKRMVVNPDNYTIKVDTTFKNTPFESILALPEKIVPQEGGNFLIPSYENQSVFAAYANTTERAIIQASKYANPIENELDNVSVVSVGSLYFASAVVDKSEISPFFKTTMTKKNEEGKELPDILTGFIKYRVPPGTKELKTSQIFYIGPKDMGILASIDERLTNVVNFGWFGWIAKPLLSMMNLFYSFLNNYGLSIILMTLIIRMLMLPLMVSSYKSMKKMQKLQPLMNQIREKHKDNPQQMNVEVMNLYKTHQVNPLGGCLPMFLQLPIFMALYSLLGHSIELYKAPFAFWIQDLSYKDPFYVLPVLMGAAMFIQQKITPSTMDPTQQKIFLFMPVFFSFLMLTLPSGLTLYMFVSSLFGLVQQYYFLNDPKELNQSKAAKNA